MKKLVFAAVAAMTVVAVSASFASKYNNNMNFAVPADTTVTTGTDDTVSEEPATVTPAQETPAQEAPATEQTDTVKASNDDTAMLYQG